MKRSKVDERVMAGRNYVGRSDTRSCDCLEITIAPWNKADSSSTQRQC